MDVHAVRAGQAPHGAAGSKAGRLAHASGLPPRQPGHGHFAAAHSFGSSVAQKLLSVQNRPNICFWSSSSVPAPCLTDLGRYHSW